MTADKPEPKLTVKIGDEAVPIEDVVESMFGSDKRRCRNCKFWDRDETEGQVELSATHYCNRPKMFWDATEWTNEDPNSEDRYTIRALKADAKDDLMFVQDGSDYAAYLITRADFFCAHHEPMEKAGG